MIAAYKWVYSVFKWLKLLCHIFMYTSVQKISFFDTPCCTIFCLQLFCGHILVLLRLEFRIILIIISICICDDAKNFHSKHKPTNLEWTKFQPKSISILSSIQLSNVFRYTRFTETYYHYSTKSRKIIEKERKFGT